MNISPFAVLGLKALVASKMQQGLSGFHLGGGGGGGIRPLLECVCPPLDIMWSYISDNDAPPQHPEFYICPPFGNFLNETLAIVNFAQALNVPQ